MRPLFFLILTLNLFNAQNGFASTLVLEFPDQRQIAMGTDPAEGFQFQLWRCSSQAGGQRLSESRSMAQIRENPNARCMPVTRNPIDYTRMPEAALQTSQDWAHVLSNPENLNHIVQSIEQGRALGRFPDWAIDSTYVLVNIRVGNTEYNMYVPKVGDVRNHLLTTINQRFNNFLLNNASFIHLPGFYWQANNRVAVEVIFDQNRFYQQAEQFAEMAEWSESQIRLNQECQETLANFIRDHQALVDELRNAGATDSESLAFISRYQLVLASPLTRTQQDERFPHTLGNQCAQRLSQLQQLAAERSSVDANAIRPLKPELVQAFTMSRDRIVNTPDRVSGR
jgi:hypothetical protein